MTSRDRHAGLRAVIQIWIPAFAGMTFITSCTTPSPQPYTLPTPVAQTGPQHILLGQPIDVNTTDAATLEALPGVGPSLAQAIIADRTQHGPFRNAADLNRVRGIGDKLLSRLAPFISASSKQ